MHLEITAHTTSGPVVYSGEAPELLAVERAVRSVLSEAMGTWSPEHAAGVRAIMRDLREHGEHHSKSLTVTLS